MMNNSRMHVAGTVVSESNRAQLLALLALPLPHYCCSALKPDEAEEELIWSRLACIRLKFNVFRLV
jgi:hypothetical protein